MGPLLAPLVPGQTKKWLKRHCLVLLALSADLLPRIALNWQPRNGADTIDELFYAQEFQKHGSCSITRLSVEDYFTTALDLHRRYPFLVRPYLLLPHNMCS